MKDTKSEGLGDTIAKITSATKLDKLAEKIAEVAGAEDCGCNGRREALNKMFPYKDHKRKNKKPNPFPVKE